MALGEGKPYLCYDIVVLSCQEINLLIEHLDYNLSELSKAT